MARPQLSPVALEALRAVDQEMAAGIDVAVLNQPLPPAMPPPPPAKETRK